MLAALGGTAAAPSRGASPVPAANGDMSPLVFIAIILLFLFLRFYVFRGSGIWISSGGGSWRSGSGGGFSSGGFSGGGGSFGGGGASGKW
jgi:uncharacterized protein